MRYQFNLDREGDWTVALAQRRRRGEGASNALLDAVRDCAERGRSCLVVSLALGTTYEGRFSEASAQGVDVEMSGDAEEVEFQPQALCLVAFQHNAHTKAFMTHVREPHREDPAKPLVITLRPPESGLSLQGRTLFRTPLLEGHGLQVTAEFPDGSSHSVEPADISIAGIGLRFPDRDPLLTVGTEVLLELRHGARTLRLGASVRHSDGRGRYGFFFPGVLRDDEILPPPDLQEMVAELQRAWLRRRAG